MEGYAGEIVAAIGLTKTGTGDTLCDSTKPIVLESIKFPEPVISLAIEPKTKADEEKLSIALDKLSIEDPTFRVKTDVDTGQTIISGMGELHLEILVDRMMREFSVEANIGRPQVAYKETIRQAATGVGRYIRQTAGPGQYGHAAVELEPLGRGDGFKVVAGIKGGVMPNQYIPAVEKGVLAGMDRGPLAGFPVVDVQAALFFGKYHDVDSSEMAFKIAAETCFHQTMLKANPSLLEPIEEVQVRVPEEYLGDVMGDMSSRRGKILGTESDGHYQVIRALVPMSELYKYSTHLRSITQGRGVHESRHSHYEDVPRELAEKVIAAARAEKEAGAHTP